MDGKKTYTHIRIHPHADTCATNHAEEGRGDGKDSGFVEGVFGIKFASLENVESDSEDEEEGSCVCVCLFVCVCVCYACTYVYLCILSYVLKPACKRLMCVRT